GARRREPDADRIPRRPGAVRRPDRARARQRGGGGAGGEADGEAAEASRRAARRRPDPAGDRRGADPRRARGPRRRRDRDPRRAGAPGQGVRSDRADGGRAAGDGRARRGAAGRASHPGRSAARGSADRLRHGPPDRARILGRRPRRARALHDLGRGMGGRFLSRLLSAPAWTRRRRGDPLLMRALYVLLGDPVAHSRSPAIHARAFELLSVDAVYAPCRVTDVPAAVRALRTLGVAGANVTIPHKQAVAAAVDRLDETARRIGAVNCVVNRDGVLHGHNTDRDGILRAAGHFSGRAVVLGAGGSARAAVDAFRPQVTIVNRTRSRAEELAREMGVEAGGADAVARADLVVNCTTVGMTGEEMPVDPAMLRGAVIDLA